MGDRVNDGTGLDEESSVGIAIPLHDHYPTEDNAHRTKIRHSSFAVQKMNWRGGDDNRGGDDKSTPSFSVGAGRRDCNFYCRTISLPRGSKHVSQRLIRRGIDSVTYRGVDLGGEGCPSLFEGVLGDGDGASAEIWMRATRRLYSRTIQRGCHCGSS